MIYIAYASTNGAENSAPFVENLKNKRAAAAERGSLAARLLLCELWREKMGGEMPEILHTGEGKPYFAGSSVSLSISHTASRVAVAIATDGEGELGIDIENISSSEKAVRAVERFAPNGFLEYINGIFSYKTEHEISSGEQKAFPDYEISFYCFREHGAVKAPDFSGIALLSLLEEEVPSFALRELSYGGGDEAVRAWCALEALLKARGTGFVSYKKEELMPLAEKALLKGFFISSEGDTHALVLSLLPM